MMSIATCYDKSSAADGVSRDEMKANARLIAAAPELLDALQSLLARVSSDIIANQCWHEEQRAARAAIAKATNP